MTSLLIDDFINRGAVSEIVLTMTIPKLMDITCKHMAVPDKPMTVIIKQRAVLDKQMTVIVKQRSHLDKSLHLASCDIYASR